MSAVDEATDQLYAAVAKWVRVHGGTAVVAGGVGIMPGERKLIYNVCIRVTGRPPVVTERRLLPEGESE